MTQFKTEWIAQNLTIEPAIIFDVGTYDAKDAILFKRAHPGARVIAFEADKDNYAAILMEGLAAQEGVEVQHAAVCDCDGEVEFHSNSDERLNRKLGMSGSILKPTERLSKDAPHLQFREPYRVESIRLDSFCAGAGIAAIDLLHVDVQGAELSVLRGLGSLRPKLIFLETDETVEHGHYEGAGSLPDIKKWFAEEGYAERINLGSDSLYVHWSASKKTEVTVISNPVLENLTVCVTSYRRPEMLDRALKSIRAAGIRRVAIGASDACSGTEFTIDWNRNGWLSYDVNYTHDDVGCNDTWMLAAYPSRTERIILMHDDDELLPEFGETYCKIISPILDSGVGFASWRAHVKNEDGSIRPTEYWQGGTKVCPSNDLRGLVARFGTLSLSPVISVLNRTVLIRACKEARETLVHNECLERPGMLLGTEIMVYLRTIQAFPNWLYVDKILSYYGSHMGSGTVRAERSGDLRPLTRGYDRARTQAIMRKGITPPSQIILVHAPYQPKDKDETRRMENARATWNFLFGQFQMVERAVCEKELTRTGKDVGDEHGTPYVRDLLDAGCRTALPEDIIVYINEDIGLTTEAVSRLVAGVERGKGVTICPRRVLTCPTPGRAYRTVKNCKVDGGMDVIAMTPAWWALHRDKMPDMLIGREAWDICLRTLAEEWADGGGPHNFMTIQPEDWWRSRAYTDDVCWHEPHDSHWKVARRENAGGAHNRKLARTFFQERQNKMGMACVAEPITGPKVTVTIEPKKNDPSP